LALTEKETLILLNLMAAGDQAAARKFYQAYAPVVKGFLKGGGWESSLVEDAVQATMLESGSTRIAISRVAAPSSKPGCWASQTGA